MMKKPELLAPAGDLKRCRTAVRYGADAVYIGGQSFSLRSRASNFTNEDIAEACRFARTHGSRIHVTVNMIPHEKDFEGLREYLMFLEKAGVTAVITASPSVMKTAAEAAPSLEVHCSTQMSVTSSEGAAFLAETLGISRVVLARECTMDEVRKITSACRIETEAFIHGGMCVNYSGRCTLSNRMTLRDGNRGGCAQSCRWQYHLYDGDRELTDDNLFTMGSKDLCAAEYIYDLMDAGVSSLKIEGRMKTEYYVASVVSAYRHLIDEIAGTGRRPDPQRMAYHTQEILRGENRETWGGFYTGERGLKSLIFRPNSNADVKHDFYGTVKEYRPEKGTAVIETRNPFSVGECAEVLSPGKTNRQFVIREMRDSEGNMMTSSRHPMALVEVGIPFETEPDDIIRRGEI